MKKGHVITSRKEETEKDDAKHVSERKKQRRNFSTEGGLAIKIGEKNSGAYGGKGTEKWPSGQGRCKRAFRLDCEETKVKRKRGRGTKKRGGKNIEEKKIFTAVGKLQDARKTSSTLCKKNR